MRGLAAAIVALLWAGSLAPQAEAAPLTPPRLESCPEVTYPPGLDEGAQQVELLLELSTTGRARVLEASGLEPFLTLAAEAVAGCRFTPALEAGEPVAVEIPFTWSFPAPPVQLQLTLRDRADRQPLAGLTVQVGDRVVQTDDDGTLNLAGLLPGTLSIRLLDEGWRAPTVDAEILAGERLELDLWASRPGPSDSEVVGTYRPDETTTERRLLSREEVRATPGSLGDPIRALHSRPGLARTPFDAGWLLVRGGGYEDTGLFLDGVRIPLLFHLGGFTSVLHPEMTESVRFWPGATPPRYQANAGAVDVIPREIGDQTLVVAGVNTVFTHVFAETPLGERGGIALAGRRSYLDGVLSLVLDPERARIAPRFWDGQAHLQFDRSHLLILGLSDTFEAPITLGEEFISVTQQGLQIQGRTEVDIGRSTLRIAPWMAIHTRTLAPISASSDEGGLVADQRIVERFPGMRVELRGPTDAPLRTQVGVESEFRSFLLFYRPDWRRAPAFTADPYLNLSTGTDVLFETGMRLDTLFTPGHAPRAAPSPRARIRWQANDWLALSGEAARTHKPPTSALLYGLPEGLYMPLQQVDSVATGLELRGARWTVGVDLYRRVLAYHAQLDVDGSPVLFRGDARGIEAHGHWAPGPFDLSFLYQVGQSTLSGTPRAPERAHPFDQTHRLELQALWSLPRDWTLSGRWRFSSGFPRRPGSPPYPVSAYDLLTQRELALGLPIDALRMAPFHALDLKVARRIPFRKWELDAWLDVQNVYNRRVVEPLITGFPEPDPAYGFGLPILPIFGLEGRFGPGAGRADQASRH